MSKLKELIDRLCPDGVQYKHISEIMIPLKKGTLKVTDLIENGKYPVINSGRDLYGNYDSFNNIGPAITIAARGEYAGWISYFENKFWAGGLCYPYKSKDENSIITKFIYYWLKNQEGHIMENLVARGSIPALNKSDIDKYQVPVPPLEVQEEIVRILDKFDSYAAELQAELQLRKEQYEYYRNLLLTFNPSAYGCGTDGEQEIKEYTWGGKSYPIEWKTMGEMGEFIRGKRFVRTDIIEQGIPCIHYGDMYTHYGLYATQTPGFINNEVAKKMRFAEKNDVVIVAAGENKDDLGNALAWLGEEPAAVHDACFIFKSKFYPNYLSHICRTTNYHKQVRMFANEAKICSVSGKDLAKVKIPIPPYDLQVKVASILDRFETLVNDLTKGLPAEIAAVKEQYEYYRNKLLTFKQLA